MSSPSDSTSLKSLKSSRRRRWDIKSKELDTYSLSLDKQCGTKSKSKSPYNSNNRNKKKLPQIYDKTGLNQNTDPEHNADILSVKLSAIINNSEKNADNYSMRSPSAPPLTPMKSVENEKLRKKSKLGKSSMLLKNSKILEQLKYLKDDVVENESKGKSNSGIVLPHSPSIINGNVNTIYCERLNNFVISQKSNLNPEVHEEINFSNISSRKTHALNIQIGFHSFALLCQGILAGISLAHCLMVFIYVSRDSDAILKEKMVEQVFFSLFSFLISICLVASFDRYDLAGKGFLNEHGLRIPWSPFFYALTIILHLSLVGTEDFIINFENYPDVLKLKRENWLSWWKYVVLARSCFAMLGWVAVVANPLADALRSRISNTFHD